MDENKQLYTIIMRHDTSTQWAVNNPILTLGEYAVEDDTHRVKRGDGETEWNDLPYEEFGLVYLVTYKNLSGEVTDNPQLTEALDSKMSIAVFEDVGYQDVSSINIEAEGGAIGKITKISKNINTATTDTNMLLIKSTDNSIQGYWSVDNEGIRILNLIAESSITDYEVGHMYYRDQLCYYRNRLYRAVENFEAEADFNPIHWVILASKHAEDIAYDNLASELDSDNVQDALDELKRRNDTKVTKSTEHRVVYATDTQGKQTVIPIDDLRTVDTVNGIPATDQVSKNIQIDAKGINYDDDAVEPETIKEKLDQKVDKTVAGEGAKIVRDVQFNYNTETGHITLTEDKVSLEDGSSDVEEVEIDVVSEQELSDEVQTLNDRIDTEVDTLNARVDDEVDTLNARIDTEVATLNDTITTKETAIYNRIQAEHDEINLRVTNEVASLNATITTLDNKVDSNITRLDGRIDLSIEDYTSKINNLANVVANNKTDIESKLTNAQATINNRIDSEVFTLNERIDTEVNDLNDRIDTEVDTLNDRIDTEVSDLHIYIDTQDNLKIDKSIADSIVTLVDVASHDNQPTIRITNKNTQSKLPTYDYVHFTTTGNIAVSMADADHLVIDSTAIDTMDTQQNTRLTNAEGRLDAHDTSIASLFEHDVNHDRTLATHTAQIAVHEGRLDTDEANISTLQDDLETEASTRESSDNALSGRITTNAVAITTKVDKTFATNTDNKVVGKLESDVIANNELINLKETFVSPQDGSSSTSNIKIISSDNTVIATRLQDGTIDLATNLDTDVNYFVTTDIISTTIGAETTLDMNHLTPTDKINVEVQDIITDPEGTWGRVKSIDNTNDECVVVTFKKHAQAVWGTIKGTLSNQQDLQAELTGLDTAKVDKTNSANKVYGTDNQGNQITYDKDSFGKVDTVNNIQADNNKNVSLDSSNINVDDTEANPVTIRTVLDNLISDLQNQIKQYTQGTYYNVGGNYTTQNYVTLENSEGVVLMAKVLRPFTSDSTAITTYDSFIADVENDNLMLIGIPEEVVITTPVVNWNYYTTVSIFNTTSGDGVNPIVDVFYDSNDSYHVGFKFINNSSYDTLQIGGDVFMTVDKNFVSDIIGLNMPSEYMYYDNAYSLMNEFTFAFIAPPPDWTLYDTVTITNVTSSDNQHPTVNVYEDLNNPYNVGFTINNPSSTEMIEVRGWMSEDILPNSSTFQMSWIMQNQYSYYANENVLLDMFNFTFTTPHNWVFQRTIYISDNSHSGNVDVYKDLLNSNDTKFIIYNNDGDAYLKVEGLVSGQWTNIPANIYPYGTATITTDCTNADLLINQSDLENIMSFTWLSSNWQFVNSYTLQSPTSIDNATPVVDVYEDINNIFTGTKFIIYNNSQNSDLNCTHVPSGTMLYISPSQSSTYTTNDVLPANVNQVYIENNFLFNYNMRGSRLHITFEDTNGLILDPAIEFNNINATLTTDYSFSYTYYSVTNSYLTFEGVDDGISVYINFDCDEYVMQTPAQIAYMTMGDTDVYTTVILVAKTASEQSFDILNNVDGLQENYEGQGGTDQEIEDILDDVLGIN